MQSQAGNRKPQCHAPHEKSISKRRDGCTAGGCHPQTVGEAILDETHGSDAARRLAIVWDPEFIARLPRQVEVAARTYLRCGA